MASVDEIDNIGAELAIQSWLPSRVSISQDLLWYFLFRKSHYYCQSIRLPHAKWIS